MKKADAPGLTPDSVRIALINPLGDFGISVYTHELAEGLAANGAWVDVFETVGMNEEIASFPRRHGLFPVLGRFIFRQEREQKIAERHGDAPPAAASPTKRTYMPKLQPLREFLMNLELAVRLRRRGYDFIWTQWPEIIGRGTGFWRWCKLLRIPVVHTIHNVLPHEEEQDDAQRCRTVYGLCDRLIVHSVFARQQLLSLFPNLAAKVLVSRHGMHSVFMRHPEARSGWRNRLGLRTNDIALLCCGAIRPYKNVDRVIEALLDARCEDSVLIVAGKEPGNDPDPLRRTRALVTELGLSERTRLLPGFLSFSEMAELFEAADVLVLPYIQGYGSGLLLQGMSFGNYIISTRTGGADEYLAHYPLATLIEGAGSDDIAAGIADAARVLRAPARKRLATENPALTWEAIASDLLKSLLGRESAGGASPLDQSREQNVAATGRSGPS
jgi:glycosyltransferase involved in cell wall biosynthesis